MSKELGRFVMNILRRIQFWDALVERIIQIPITKHNDEMTRRIAEARAILRERTDW